MYDKAAILKKIEEHESAWEKLSAEMQEQYTAQYAAYAGRINLLKEMVADLEKLEKAAVDTIDSASGAEDKAKEQIHE